MAPAAITINTDIINHDHFDRNGNSFRNGTPEISYRSTFQVRWHLFTDVPNADEENVDISKWSTADFSGCGALLTCDNDFRHRVSGTLATEINSGDSVSVIEVQTSASASEIPEEGLIALHDANGNVSDLEYSGITSVDGGYSCTLLDSFIAETSYPAGASANISQEPLFQSMYDSEESNPAVGLFVFNCYAYSKRLAALADTSTSKTIRIQGLELLPFTQENSVVKELPAYLIDTVSLEINLAEVGAAIPEYIGDPSAAIAALAALVVQGVDVQVYSQDSDWHFPGDLSDTEYAKTLTAYRIRFAGSTGAWSDPLPLIQGMDAPHVMIQYSPDGGGWNDTPENSKYIRFSTDDGTTWSDAQQYAGENAPQIILEYSPNGTANTWHGIAQTDDYFIRASVDGGASFGNAMQFKAYTVIYQYGTTASGVFHDTFDAASDKYIRWSNDNGITWSAAAKFMGDKGDNFTINATGTLENRSLYDAERSGFSYLVTAGEQAGYIFFKNDTGWGDAIKFTPDGVAVEYSPDAYVWSSSPDENTVYMRISLDGGASWKDPVRIKGTSTYIYTAYASDASGNDFSLVRNNALDYWNWIYTNEPITDSGLTAEKFASEGTGWTQFQGDDGISYEWLSGTVVPDVSAGKDGDWFINTAAGDLYKKISGNWVWQMNIIGKSGAGITLKGAWDLSAVYSKDDGVTFNGSFYIAKQDNQGKVPDVSTSFWTLYVQKGAEGEPGKPGAVLDGLYRDVNEITADGFMVFDKSAVPCAVEIADRTFEISEVIVTDDHFKVAVDPILAAADLAAFSGSWRVWFNGGAKGEKGDKGDLADFRNTITFTAENIDLNADTDTTSSYALRIQDKNAQGLGAFIVHQGDNQDGVNVIRLMLRINNRNLPAAEVGLEIIRNADGTFSSNTFATPEPPTSAKDSRIATTAWVKTVIEQELAKL